MSVRKRSWKNGDGETASRWVVDLADGNGNRARRQFDSRKEADAYRVEIENAMRTGTYRPDAAKVTVKEAAEMFLEHCEARQKRNERMTRHNLKGYEGHIYNYICPDPARHAGSSRHKRLRSIECGLTMIRLGQLTTRSVSDFRDRLRDAGVSVPTTRKILCTLQQVLGYAISRDLIAVNVARGVRVIGRRDEGARKIMPPTKETMRRLIEAADPDFRTLLIVASATGIRAGELRALRWKHLDFANNEVKIETRVDAYGEEDVTKTAAGMRTVPLGNSVVTALKAWKLRSVFSEPTDLVFPNKRGRYVSHDNMVKRDFGPLFDVLAARHAEDPVKHPPAPPRFNWHALRHFAISCWIEAGLAPKTVQTFAGHSSLQVTMDIYGHLFKSDDHTQAMNKIAGDLFG